jgi:hypothetical protein
MGGERSLFDKEGKNTVAENSSFPLHKSQQQKNVP